MIFIFFERFEKLCKSIGSNPTAVAIKLEISKSNVTYWKKNGTEPSTDILKKIAEYFDVSVDYLLGKTDQINKASPKSNTSDETNVVRIIGRDGKYTEKRLTDEQIKALEMMIAQLPKPPDDL